MDVVVDVYVVVVVDLHVVVDANVVVVVCLNASACTHTTASATTSRTTFTFTGARAAQVHAGVQVENRIRALKVFRPAAQSLVPFSRIGEGGSAV